MIADNILNSTQYVKIHPLFKKAFNFLIKEDLHSYKDGRVDIMGDDLFAIFNTYQTKPNDGKWETHNKYIDIQFILKGKESIGCTYVKNLKAVTKYNPKKDIKFYSGDGNYLKMEEGMFSIFFPDDAHIPGLNYDSLQQVRKIVLKVKIK